MIGKRGGTYLCMEGPQFSTKAESNVYRSWGMDVIGMTNLQEARLAREAEICYVTVAMVTDYDCWHPHHDSVTVEQIVAVLLKNAENATQRSRETVAAMPKERTCKCGSALATPSSPIASKIPPATRQKLKLILDKYLEGQESMSIRRSLVQLHSIPSNSLGQSRRRTRWRCHIFLLAPATSRMFAWSPSSARTSPPNTKTS